MPMDWNPFLHRRCPSSSEFSSLAPRRCDISGTRAAGGTAGGGAMASKERSGAPGAAAFVGVDMYRTQCMHAFV